MRGVTSIPRCSETPVTVQVQLPSISRLVPVILNWLSLVTPQAPPDSGATVSAPVSDHNHTYPAMHQGHLASSCHYPRALASVQYLDISTCPEPKASMQVGCRFLGNLISGPSSRLEGAHPSRAQLPYQEGEPARSPGYHGFQSEAVSFPEWTPILTFCF